MVPEYKKETSLQEKEYVPSGKGIRSFGGKNTVPSGERCRCSGGKNTVVSEYGRPPVSIGAAARISATARPDMLERPPETDFYSVIGCPFWGSRTSGGSRGLFADVDGRLHKGCRDNSWQSRASTR